MILPNVRASFGRDEAGAIVALLAGPEPGAREHLEQRLQSEGFDALLDDPRTLNGLLAATSRTDAPPRLVFYVMVRHALLECGIDDTVLADYVAALLLAFGHADRARRIDDDDPDRFDYLVDLVAALDTAHGRRAFLLQAHLGNFALWISGLFPDHITARAHDRGAPGLDYYQTLGASAFRQAAHTELASRFGLETLYHNCAETFPVLRISLNRLSDRYLFPRWGDPLERLLRQVESEHALRNQGH